MMTKSSAKYKYRAGLNLFQSILRPSQKVCGKNRLPEVLSVFGLPRRSGMKFKIKRGRDKTMTTDPKRELFRHLIATVAFRTKVAVSNARADFANFRINETIRTPGEILAHMGDLLEGSLYLLKGEFVILNSAPLAWNDEVKRFFGAVKKIDAYLASNTPLAQPVEKMIQGPIADGLTHVGQLIMLRRAAGDPAAPEGYFTAEIIPGEEWI
jgi:hypothetical protein